MVTSSDVERWTNLRKGVGHSGSGPRVNHVSGSGRIGGAMDPRLLPLHLGSLHPVEQVLVYVLAFGPFVVLGGVVWWRRRTEGRQRVR